MRGSDGSSSVLLCIYHNKSVLHIKNIKNLKMQYSSNFLEYLFDVALIGILRSSQRSQLQLMKKQNNKEIDYKTW